MAPPASRDECKHDGYHGNGLSLTEGEAAKQAVDVHVIPHVVVPP
jgi:hypothetical protein